MDERCAILNMPTMALATYFRIQSQIHHKIRDFALEETKRSHELETKECIVRGEVDHDGFPLYTVVTDGAWAKRSYKSGYSSLSGVVSNYLLIYGSIKYELKD